MLKNYIKIAWKVLLRRKFFTFVSLFGIVFTLLVLMVVSSFLDTYLFPAEPGSRFGRTLLVDRIELKGEKSHISSTPSYYFFDRYVRSMQTAELVSIHSRAGGTVSYVQGNKLDLSLKHTDAAFWSVMEFDFIEGSSFDEDAVASTQRVAVITDKTALEVFGKTSAIGQFLETTDGAFRIIGVIPHKKIRSDFAFADIYVPISLDQYSMRSQSLWGRHSALVVMPEGSDIEQIKADFEHQLDRAREEAKDRFHTVTCVMGTMWEQAVVHIIGTETGGGMLAFGSIIGLMILFMLFPALNLININMSRIVERSSEVGVRRAFGASRRTLIGQFLVENIVLTFIGGAIALVLSGITLSIVTDSGFIPWGEFEINLRVFAYAVCLCLTFGIISGVLPAYRMSRMHPVDALRGGEV